jgi:metal-sulfur cluster biosynthetic enzyme
MKITKNMVMEELKKVIDPEIGIPITEMKLIDDIKIEKDKVLIEFHLTMPFCPAVFATKIASDIKNFVSKIKGVKSVQVILKNHFMADEINKEINK